MIDLKPVPVTLHFLSTSETKNTSLEVDGVDELPWPQWLYHFACFLQGMGYSGVVERLSNEFTDAELYGKH
jgi:hypothetical protein